MLIKVTYENGEHREVKPFQLDKLISSGKIKKFRRSEGWVTIGVDSIRGTGGGYDGPERRRRSLMNELTELRQKIEELEIPDAERNKIYEALKKSEALYHSIVETAQEGIVVLDMEGRISYTNQQMAEMLGYTIQEMLGNHLFEFMDEEGQIRYKKGIREIKELCFFKKNGSHLWAMISTSPLFDAQGKYIGVLGMITDITERKEKEEALSISEEKYRTIADFTYDWECWIGPDGQCIYISPSCERISGYRSEEFMADPELLVKITHHEDRDIVNKHFHKESQKRKNVYNLDFRIITRNNEIRWISHCCQSVYHSNGSWLGRRGSNRDITERMQAVEEVQSLNRELQQKIFELAEANKELETFNRTISHDLQTPLVAIGGFVRRFLKKAVSKLDTDEKELLNTVQMSVKRMERLIKDLLLFSRAGQQEINPKEMDIRDIVATALDELKSLTEDRNITFNIQALPPAYGDEALMKQVVINLLSNAIKFTRLKDIAVVEVGCRVENDENIYYVKDNGIGFYPRHADKLFSIFKRLPEAKDFEGTGVGLSIVQRIVNRHGGRVWAEGQVNEGATFYFSLPKE